jgi:hypothetical protein
MADIVHKYYCIFCRLYVFGATAARLAIALNQHNDKMHPQAFAGWTETSLVHSHQYAGPSATPPYLDQYTHSKEWGDAKPPDITERDKVFLKGNLITW